MNKQKMDNIGLNCRTFQRNLVSFLFLKWSYNNPCPLGLVGALEHLTPEWINKMEHKYIMSDWMTTKYKKETFWVKRGSVYWPLKRGRVKCVCVTGEEGRGRFGEDVLPECSSPPSHGIEMETVGFLPLLPVVRFLHTQTDRVKDLWSNFIQQYLLFLI